MNVLGNRDAPFMLFICAFLLKKVYNIRIKYNILLYLLTNMKQPFLLLFIASTLILTACGGEGSGGGF